METSKTYYTRLKRKSVESHPKSKVDWKRTKRDDITHVGDSDESLTSEQEEETDEESEDSSCTDESEVQQDKASLDEDDGDEGRIKKPKLKSKSAVIGSDSSSDSDGPSEKVKAKRSCVISDDDSDEVVAVESSHKETKAHVKKLKRLETLKQLAERRRCRNRTTSRETTEESPDEEDDDSATSAREALCKSEDSDDMANFIVSDEEENNAGGTRKPITDYKELFKKHHISLSASHDLPSHLEKVIKAFLINITDNKFLKTLYEGVRKKRYAKDMLKSLNYLDDRIIGPRLEKLTTSCRWTRRYKERVDSYPHLLLKRIPAEEMSCEACDLKRYCSYLVTLSGQAYDNETLECDDFLGNNKQMLVIGGVCARRTEAYHLLRHYKYFMYQRCIPFINDNKEESAKETVESALLEMEEKGFLGQEVLFLEGYLHEADYFQEEKMDSLLS